MLIMSYSSTHHGNRPNCDDATLRWRSIDSLQRIDKFGNGGCGLLDAHLHIDAGHLFETAICRGA